MPLARPIEALRNDFQGVPVDDLAAVPQLVLNTAAICAAPGVPSPRKPCRNWVNALPLFLLLTAGPATSHAEPTFPGLSIESICDTVPPAGEAGPHGLIIVEGGQFQMGNNDTDDERPVHQVSLRTYALGKYEVSFDDFDLFCQTTGRTLPGDEGWGRGKRPVINVTWYDAVAYCNWLSLNDSLTPAYQITADTIVVFNRAGSGYRLPTEAEWEYAARGGKLRQNHTYSGSDDANAVAWYSENTADAMTQPVGGKAPNALGLYDMSGNVREWCYDRFVKYAAGTFINPTGSQYARERVLRGGCWNRNLIQLQCTYRISASPDIRDNNTGFRIARNE